MLKYIILLSILYSITLLKKPIYTTSNKAIDFKIEKNLYVLFTSILGLIIIWEGVREDIIFTILLIMLNLFLWIKVKELNNFENEIKSANDFILNQKYCDYQKNLEPTKQTLPAKKQIKDNGEWEPQPNETIETVLDSDDLYSWQQKENECIMATFIPDYSLLSNNLVPKILTTC